MVLPYDTGSLLLCQGFSVVRNLSNMFIYREVNIITYFSHHKRHLVFLVGIFPNGGSVSFELWAYLNGGMLLSDNALGVGPDPDP